MSRSRRDNFVEKWRQRTVPPPEARAARGTTQNELLLGSAERECQSKRIRPAFAKRLLAASLHRGRARSLSPHDYDPLDSTAPLMDRFRVAAASARTDRDRRVRGPNLDWLPTSETPSRET